MHDHPIFSKSPSRFEERPWGSFTVLDVGTGYRVKRVEVLPCKRLSYQKHHRLVQYWLIVQGAGKVILDNRQIVLHTGQTVQIPVNTAHNIENPCLEKLILIEIQRGDYPSEDDSEKMPDNFEEINHVQPLSKQAANGG